MLIENRFLSGPPSPHITANIDRVLRAVRDFLRMDIAFVAEFLGPHRVFRSVVSDDPNGSIQVGGTVPMADGYCAHVVSGRLPELIRDTSFFPFAASMPETAAMPIGAHVSVPIRLGDGRIYGTFCCISHKPQPELTQRDLKVVHTFAALLAADLTVDLATKDALALKARRVCDMIDFGDPDIVLQPVIRLQDCAVTGVEALSRFRSPPHMSPDLWFADAHAVGLGPKLELWAAEKAAKLCDSLPPNLALSFNMSPATILGGGIREALRHTNPKRIVIELTEHAPIENYGALVMAFEPLRQAGMRIAIDDAGAGYSSMKHVLALRPDIIKFDVSLTRNIDHDAMRQAMIAALTEFARRTDTQVVAEGVETEAELRMLLSLNVDKAQGYLLAPPTARDDLIVNLGRIQNEARKKLSAVR